MKARVAAYAVAALFLASAAGADTPPTVWDRAKDPAVGERYRLHVRVEEFRQQADEYEQKHLGRMKDVFLERARGELEMASASTSPDLRLRFDLGAVCQDLKRYKEALAVLQEALELAPRDSAAADGWAQLALAAAHLDMSKEEVRGYDGALALSLSHRRNMNLVANRAEAEMRLGNLDEAIDGYREVITLVEHERYGTLNDYETLVLARWGLVVALDRNSQPADAEHEAWIAAQQDPVEKFIGDTENVFFVPEYERDWYLALGRAQHAKHEPDAGKAVMFWKLTVATWADFIKRAEPKGDRWLPLARAHLASAQAEEQAAEARAGKAPGLPPLPKPKR